MSTVGLLSLADSDSRSPVVGRDHIHCKTIGVQGRRFYPKRIRLVEIFALRPRIVSVPKYKQLEISADKL
jgi:hypothetical protein